MCEKGKVEFLKTFWQEKSNVFENKNKKEQVSSKIHKMMIAGFPLMGVSASQTHFFWPGHFNFTTGHILAAVKMP